MAQHRRGGRGQMGFEPAHAPFEHRPRRRMGVEIGAKRRDLAGRPRILIGLQKTEIGSRRADRVDKREFAAEPLGDFRQRRVERRIAGDTMCGSTAVSPAHDKKRLAENRGVGAGEERLGHRNAGRERRLQHRKFLQPVEARRHSGVGCGAQHKPLIAIERAVIKPGVEPPILLNRPAGKRRQCR